MEENNCKPCWQIFLESSGGTALITVLIGGIFGAFITGMIQKKQSEQAYKNELYKARIAEQIKIIQNSTQLVGKIMSATGDVLESRDWDFRGYTSDEQKILKDQQIKIANKYNEISTEWNRDRFMFGFLLSYYHDNNMKIVESWNELCEKIENFKNCTDSAKKECGSTSDVEQSLQRLLTNLQSNNQL